MPQCPLKHCHGRLRRDGLRLWPLHLILTLWSSLCNTSQDLYTENTISDFREELPESIMLQGNDYEVSLASFPYPHTWYNVPDLAGRLHTAIFAFHHPHPSSGGGSRGDDDDDGGAVAATTECGKGNLPAGPKPWDTTRASGKSFISWTAMVVVAGCYFSSTFTPPTML